MNEDSKQEKLTLKKILQGTILIIISNLLLVGNNYLIAWTKLTAPEVDLVRGVLQIIIFGFIVWKSPSEFKEHNEESGPKRNWLTLCLFSVLYGLLLSTENFTAIVAISLMPIGDLIVICFSSPVFSIFADRVFRKRTLTFLSIFLSFFIIVGDILVVQPPFIFGESEPSNNVANISSKHQEDLISLEPPFLNRASLNNQTNLSDDLASLQEDSLSISETPLKRGSYYYYGVGLCLYTAAAAAIANIVNSHCSSLGVTTSHLMLTSGITSILLCLVASLFMSNRLFTSPTSLSLEAGLLLPVSGLTIMVALWTMTVAVRVTNHPTLISMLRSTEILISLVTESVWWREVPGSLSVMGSILVAVCVMAMAAHDDIVKAGRKAWGSLIGKNAQK